VSAFDVSSIFGRPPQPREYANQAEAAAIDICNHGFLRELWSCGTVSEEDKQILVFINGIFAAAQCRLPENHPATEYLDECAQAVAAMTSELRKLGNIRARAFGRYDEIFERYSKERRALDEGIMNRVHAESELLHDDSAVSQAG
jgi:hypothetical protein